MSDINRVTVEFWLPCGHRLTNSFEVNLTRRNDDYNRQPQHFAVQLYQAADYLAYWLENRADRHECGLVTEDNPSGLRRMT